MLCLLMVVFPVSRERLLTSSSKALPPTTFNLFIVSSEGFFLSPSGSAASSDGLTLAIGAHNGSKCTKVQNDGNNRVIWK